MKKSRERRIYSFIIGVVDGRRASTLKAGTVATPASTHGVYGTGYPWATSRRTPLVSLYHLMLVFISVINESLFQLMPPSQRPLKTIGTATLVDGSQREDI